MTQEINDANEGDLEILTDRGVRYLVQFPIGDWSGDGHDRCDYFFALSEQPIVRVREAHYRAGETLGFEIGDLCKKYGDNRLASDVVQKLDDLGYLPPNDIDLAEEFLPSEVLVDIWFYLLNHVDPSLHLEKTKMPSINFYGRDDKGRHLKTPGYGLFE